MELFPQNNIPGSKIPHAIPYRCLKVSTTPLAKIPQLGIIRDLSVVGGGEIDIEILL